MSAVRKQHVVLAIKAGQLSVETAVVYYRSCAEEIAAWIRDHDRDGVEGLKVTKRVPKRAANRSTGREWMAINPLADIRTREAIDNAARAIQNLARALTDARSDRAIRDLELARERLSSAMSSVTDAIGFILAP